MTSTPKKTPIKDEVIGSPGTPGSPTVMSSDPKNVEDLTVFVENLLGQMQDKFQLMSDNILTKMDEMGSRIDELESNITELMQQAGIEDAPPNN